MAAKENEVANEPGGARRTLEAAIAALEVLEQHQANLDMMQTNLDVMRKDVSVAINALCEHVDVLNSLVDADAPTVIYENTTEAEVSGNVVDGMAELIEDDITWSDYNAATEPWPGVPNIPLPKAYRHKKP